jgi:sterol 3beta-glucosyltransferase
MPHCFLLICIGTRGDVQPFLALGLSLMTQYPDSKVILGAHPEFEEFIQSFHSQFQFTPILPSFIDLLKSSSDGKILSTSQNPFKVFPAIKSMNKALFHGWADSIYGACKQHGPSLLILHMLAYFTSISTVIKRDFNVPCMILNTVPTYPTAEFAPPTAGVGQSMHLNVLNRLLWIVSSKLAYQWLFRDICNEVLQRYVHLPRQRDFCIEMDEDNVPNLYVYSSCLLKRPKDWPWNHQVAGYLDIRQFDKSHLEPIPIELGQFISTATSHFTPLIYISLGSMLNVIFPTKEKVFSVLKDLMLGVKRASKTMFISAIIHIVCGNENQVTKEELMPLIEGDSNIYILDRPVAHSLLFQHVQCIVHHGGMGTTHAALLAAVPSIILPCGPTSDQPFWADVIVRKKLGPKGFLIKDLSPKRFANCIEKAMDSLHVYTFNARRVSEGMHAENGNYRALSMIDKILNGNYGLSL